MKVSNKGGRGQRKREQIGVGATCARLNKTAMHATQALLAFNEVTWLIARLRIYLKVSALSLQSILLSNFLFTVYLDFFLEAFFDLVQSVDRYTTLINPKPVIIVRGLASET